MPGPIGLGESTGIELAGDHRRQRPDRTYSAKRLAQTWYAGNTLSAAIGQADNLFTPLQIGQLCGHAGQRRHPLLPPTCSSG